ncbi:unannotated protein [freshwater metagenome]|uniref:Unannotated protein n=1 Tax=freshwater metagenome TaxID=449393 RepID=A0A6J6RYK7_9ZZZZ
MGLMSDYRGMTAIENAVLANLHPVNADCYRRGCVIHAPSDHPLRDAPLYAIGTDLFRGCEHLDLSGGEPEGLHLDPDHMNWLQGPTRWEGWQARFWHGGCCPQRCCEAHGDE